MAARKTADKKSDVPKEEAHALEALSGEPSACLVNTQLVEEAVRFINEKATETMYRGSEEIGKYLLEYFFQNDIDLASSKNPHKSASYAELCRRPDLVVHPSTLSTMVRVAAQEGFFEKAGVNTAGLSYTHKAELVKLPNTDTKITLVKSALEGSYTSRQVADEVKRIKAETGEGEAPKASLLMAAVERVIDKPARLCCQPDRVDFLLASSNLQRMKPETRQKLYDKILATIEQTKSWTKTYDKLRRKFEAFDRGKASEQEAVD